MAARDHRLTLAEWLIDSGSGRSAIHVLGDLRGQRANELRRLAAGAELRSRTVYALVALGDGSLGCAVPLAPAPGASRSRDPALMEACDTALDLARRTLGAPNLPSLRFELEEWLAMFGSSLGLPALLAFLGYYAPSRMPSPAILATGRLLGDGSIVPVGGMEAKLAVARAETGDKVVLMPEDTPSATEAIARIFGADPLAPERHVLTLDETIERARAEPDRNDAIAALEALPLDRFPPTDRVRIVLELGTLARHAGDSRRASELHARARALLDAERRFLGGDAAERYELECRLSAMDEFRIDESIEVLTRRVEEPFLNAHNEVRCRGMLAQALGMAGRYRDAVAARHPNVVLQGGSESLRAVLPGTYCYLALDSARAGDARGFESFAERVCTTTRPGDENQWRFDAAAIIRGLVALGRHGEAIAWAQDRCRLFGHRIPAYIARAVSGSTTGHPETSILRALARAYRRIGDAAGAVAIGRRVPRVDAGSNLIAWLAALVHLEAALAAEELGDRSASGRIADLAADLPRLHADASRFHADLIVARGSDLERAIDRVWY
jgi:hypothetical protein